jgi:hypothetical protein
MQTSVKDESAKLLVLRSGKVKAFHLTNPISGGAAREGGKREKTGGVRSTIQDS